MSGPKVYTDFPMTWKFEGEPKKPVSAGAMLITKPGVVEFQLAKKNSKITLAFPVDGPYKHVDGKRFVYPENAPEMSKREGSMAYSIGDPKLVEWFNVTFTEYAIDRLIDMAKEKPNVAAKIKEFYFKGKPVPTGADLKKALMDRVNMIVVAKDSYDPCLHTTAKWEEPDKKYSTKFLVTTKELLAKGQMDDSVDLSLATVGELRKKPWQGCQTIPVVSFSHCSILQGGIYFKFSTKTLMVTEGTSTQNSGGKVTLDNDTDEPMTDDKDKKSSAKKSEDKSNDIKVKSEEPKSDDSKKADTKSAEDKPKSPKEPKKSDDSKSSAEDSEEQPKKDDDSKPAKDKPKEVKKSTTTKKSTKPLPVNED